jgi:hypothetical protein
MSGRIDTTDGAAAASETVQVTRDERANDIWQGETPAE